MCGCVRFEFLHGSIFYFKRPILTPPNPSRAGEPKRIIPEGIYFVAQCEKCGFKGESSEWDGGGQIGDTGDYGDSYCPVCGQVDVPEADDDIYIDQRELFMTKIGQLGNRISELEWELSPVSLKWKLDMEDAFLAGQHSVLCFDDWYSKRLEEAPPTPATDVKKDPGSGELEEGGTGLGPDDPQQRHTPVKDTPVTSSTVNIEDVEKQPSYAGFTPTEQPTHVPDPKGEVPEEIMQWISDKADERTEEFKKWQGVKEGDTDPYAYRYGCLQLGKDTYYKMRDTIATLTKENQRLTAYAAEGDTKFSQLFEKCGSMIKERD